MIYPPAFRDEFVARLLIDIWTLATGRTLRDVPPHELTAEELIDFWADDQLDAEAMVAGIPAADNTTR
jgi:hypothetical protein